SEPAIVADGNDKSLFFQFKTTYNPSHDNIYVAIAPKEGRSIKITHVEYRIRFSKINSGTCGVFISKDPTFTNLSQIWKSGINRTSNKYTDYVIRVSENNYSESTSDSIRLIFAYGGASSSGMYIDNLMIYGIVDGNENSARTISVNTKNITKTLAKHPSGANTCWLMDSDTNWPRAISNETRFGEMKLGALRFPYGHLADNYLWHKPGQYTNVASTGPIAQTASSSEDPKWTWAVNTDKTFVKALSFDEYIGICKRQNIEPLICVNAQSHFYKNTIVNYQQLITSAAEWVRYANITKGYNVKYWQIGNEVDHDGNFTKETYTTAFIDFATAMKAVDPTIKVGTGVLLNTEWNKDVLNQAGSLCDFVAAHNYQMSNPVPPGGYRSWYKSNSILITNSKTMQTMLDNNFKHRPEIEMHITETNISGGDFPDMDIIDLYKALYWFEMDMNHLALKNVKYTYYWGTHSPWMGENHIGDIRTLLDNNSGNAVRPAGKIIQIINTYLKDSWLDISRENGFLRTYASVNADGSELSIFILNKNFYTEHAKINISNFDITGKRVEKALFTGDGYNDTDPQLTVLQLQKIPETVELPPISLTVFNFSNTTSVREIIDQNRQKMSFNGNELIFKEITEQNYKLIIFSVDGSIIMKKHLRTPQSPIDLSFLDSGVYLVNLSNHSNSQNLKILR
ncbi:MAG: T9SS type A sorting domain-containing protein, partial [Pigmentiphaga sp.]|nr:T9SS type A sorting domain-containing protein [Pigmentiphaga sp.]